MENLNEGKKSNYMAELAEIDKQSALVALEAKINKLAEMAEAKTNRLSMVHEDENLSELISKQAVKEMQRSIKEIEKLKEKLLKEFTKKGGKMTEVIDEEMDDKEVEEGYGSTIYEEDNTTMEEEVVAEDESEDDMHDDPGDIRIDHDYYTENLKEEDDIKEETNEEIDRWQKLAGIVTLNETMDVKSANDMQDEMVKSFGRDNLMGAAKLEIVGADKNEVKDAVELGKMTLQNMLSAIFKKYGPNFSSVTEKGKLSITPQSKEGGALSYSFVITQ